MSDRAEDLAHYSWRHSLIQTSVICVVIAVVTWLIWPSSYVEHLAISLGYGYSALGSAWVFQRVFSGLQYRQLLVLVLLSAMILGSLLAMLWTGTGVQEWEAMKSVMLLGFLFTVFCFYFFYVREQKFVAERALEQARRQQSEQEKTLVLSELKMLQSQIEPHFLFNTLANISALIDYDRETAKIMLTKLTELLRATLSANRARLVTVEHETALASAYLAIQQIRLGSRLAYTVSNSGVGDSWLIPPLLLQPLVENAVLHGIEPLADGGQITVDICEQDRRLVMRISDNGIGLGGQSQHIGHGVGLENIRHRLEVLFGCGAGLQIRGNTPAGVVAEIWIERGALDALVEKENRDERARNGSHCR
ncbi:hypothetical protein ABT56_00685 [Photobacterium aquae]|uniref:Signal transduction histidine kinase internal region domain-containing protein n=1 Tax=Photobacterium aquae TaxID=1195763 RepID=A0A0J1HDB7_9GAMM|nr:histidine kinase [Photobacterium aquae]KLV09630.1 hypothetical protein ABT56_00685 [Photobacterium aquae]